MKRNAAKNQKHREKDIRFLELLRRANPEVLVTIAQNHSHKDVPEWKRVAVDRALRRYGRVWP